MLLYKCLRHVSLWGSFNQKVYMDWKVQHIPTYSGKLYLTLMGV